MGLKTVLRSLVPLSYQVPVKYLFNRLNGTLEPELDILKLLIDSGDHVIDVGGNRGTYAYKLYRMGCHVEVFEPNNVCAKVLIAWADGKSAIRVHAVALSNTSGNAVLHIPVDSSGTAHDASASLENSPDGLVQDKTVELRTLDSFGFRDITFIKIDVEGHECSVIEGAADSIARMKPSLLVEIEQRHIRRPIAEVFEMILGFGYRGFFLRDGKLQDIGLFNAAIDQDFDGSIHATGKYINNFLFVHPATVNAKFRQCIVNAGLTL